jgi:hypothetical protein
MRAERLRRENQSSMLGDRSFRAIGSLGGTTIRLASLILLDDLT